MKSGDLRRQQSEFGRHGWRGVELLGEICYFVVIDFGKHKQRFWKTPSRVTRDQMRKPGPS